MPHDHVAKIRGWMVALIWLILLSQVHAATVTSAQSDPVAEPAQSSSAAWSEPVPLSDLGSAVDSGDPDIAVCDDGTIYVVWEQNDEIWFRVREPASGWKPAARVRFQETGQTAQGSEPAIAVGPDCTPHLVWTDEWWGTFEIFHAFNDGNGFLTQSRVSKTETGQSGQPSVAVDSAGNVRVVWVDTVSGRSELYEGWQTPPNDYWSYTPILGADEQVQVPDAAFDDDDRLHVTWMRVRGPSSDIYYKRPEFWDSFVIENISDSSNSSRLPQMTISRDKVVIVWQEDVNGDDEIFGTWRSLDSNSSDFTSRNNLSLTDASSRAPVVTVDDSGQFSVAWDEGEPTDAILTRFWGGSGGWWETRPASRAESSVRHPAIAASPRDDEVYLVWEQRDAVNDTWDIYFSDVQIEKHEFYLMVIMNNYEH